MNGQVSISELWPCPFFYLLAPTHLTTTKCPCPPPSHCAADVTQPLYGAELTNTQRVKRTGWAAYALWPWVSGFTLTGV